MFVNFNGIARVKDVAIAAYRACVNVALRRRNHSVWNVVAITRWHTPRRSGVAADANGILTSQALERISTAFWHLWRMSDLASRSSNGRARSAGIAT